MSLSTGAPLQDVWLDIKLATAAKERIGYPTQKPLALLKRIIESSTNKGDLVLDPFCGCGTTVEAAEDMGRRWIGIDIARKAIEVIEDRFKKVNLPPPEVTWHPKDPEAAAALAARDKREFERWALRKIRAARIRSKDRGIDGEAYFRDANGATMHVVVSVKGGALKPADVRELRGTIEREKAPIGVLVSMNEPSKEMRLEASRGGFLDESDREGPIPRLQLVTVERLFSDKPPIRAVGVNVTDLPRPTVPPPPGAGEQLGLALEEAAEKKPLAKTKQRAKGPAKAVPYREAAEPEYAQVAEQTRSSRPPPKRR